MRVLGVGLCCALLVASCARPRRAWEPIARPPTAAAPAAYAVVELNTPLSIEPRQGAPVVWAMPPHEVYTGARPELGVFRVLGQDDGWVSLETLGEPPALHCTGALHALEAFRLRLFAPASALMPITQREITQTFDDGTRIELARGVPLEPLSRGLFRVHLGSVTTIVRLAQTDVGTRYLPSATPARGAVTRALRGDVLAASVPVLGRTGRVQGRGARDVPVYDERARGGEALVELRPRCARMIVRVPAHAVWTVAAPQAQARDGAAASAAPRVRAGARVHWRSGAPAGVVTRDVTLAHEAPPAGRLRCFLHPLREGSDPTASVELCFERHAVVDPGAGAASLLGDPS